MRDGRRAAMTQAPTLFALAVLVSLSIAAPAQQRLQVERDLHLTGGFVTALAWSPAGDQLAVGGMIGDLVVLDPSASAEPRAPRVLRQAATPGNLVDTVGNIAWSADGQRLVFTTRTGTQRVDANDGTVLAAREAVFCHGVFVPGTTDLLGIDTNGTVHRLDGDTLRTVATIGMPAGSPAGRVAVSPNGEQLVVGTTHRCQLLVFDLATGRELREIPHDPGAVQGLAWPPGVAEPWWLAGRDLHLWGNTQRFVGDVLVCAADGARVAVCQTDGWKLLTRDGGTLALGPDHGVLALHPDGERWARGDDGRIDIGIGNQVVRSFESPVPFQNMHEGQLAGDGEFVFLAGHRGALRGFAAADGAPCSVEGLPQPGTLLAYDDGPELVWAHGRDQVTWWRPRRGAAPEPVRSLTFDLGSAELQGPPRQSGRWLTQTYRAPVDVEQQLPSPQPRMNGLPLPVEGGETRWVAASLHELQFLKDDGKTVLRTLPIEGAIAFAVSPDRKRLAVATWQDALVVEASTAKVQRGPTGIRELAWIDDDTLLGVQAGAHRGWRLVLWPSGAAEVSAHLPLGDGYALLLDISRSARRALIGQEGTARIVTWR